MVRLTTFHRCLSRLLPALCLGLAACGGGGAADDGLGTLELPEGIAYDVEIVGAPSEDIAALAEQSLRLFTLADREPGSRARLARRAEADLDTARALLKAEAYYEGEASFELRENDRESVQAPVPETADVAVQPEVPDERGARGTLPPQPVAQEPAEVTVVVTLIPGPRYTLAEHTLTPDGPLPGTDLPDAKTFEALLDGPARGAEILATEGRAVQWLRNHGYPFADSAGRRALADRETATLRVESRLAPGPKAQLGDIRTEGLTSVDRSYVESYRPAESGALYRERDLEALQDDLSQTGLFTFVSIEPAKPTADAEGGDTEAGTPVPIVVRVEEAKHRSVGGGVRYSTDAGPGVTAFFEHRNLFGSNETIRVSLLAALEEQRLTTTLRKPQFMRDGQTLVGGVSVGRIDDDAFEETAIRLNLGLEREINKRLRLGLGTTLELAEVTDDGDSSTSMLLGLPFTATYDASNDLLDPTRGIRARGAITPYAGQFDDEFTGFVVVDGGASTYLPLDEAERFVFGLRARLGTILGVERDDIPNPQRLYSGGGGSVRGYATRFIGPLDADGDPEGGRSVAELGGEIRLRVTETIGVVPFVEMGTVSDALFPDFDQGVQLAAGLGVRYYSAIGPIRADVGVPLNPRDEDDPWQLYISIGQAF